MLNNAHQIGGACGGERINQGGAVGGYGGVAMAKKHSWSQVNLREFIAVSATLSNDASHMRL